MEHHGDALGMTGADEGKLDVGAEADGDIGNARLPEARQNLRGRAPLAHERRDERPRPRAVEARDDDRDELEARLGHERPLELGRLAVEGDVMPAGAELLGERDGRIDVTCGASRSDGNLESPRHEPFLLSLEPLPSLDPRSLSVALGPRSILLLPDESVVTRPTGGREDDGRIDFVVGPPSYTRKPPRGDVPSSPDRLAERGVGVPTSEKPPSSSSPSAIRHERRFSSWTVSGSTD